MLSKLKSKFSFRTIRAKLMAAVIVCIVIPATLSLVIYNMLTEEAVKQQALQNSEDAMSLAGGSVEGLMQEMINIANYIQVNPDMNGYFKQFLLKTETRKAPDVYADFTARNRILNQLDSLTIVGEKSYISIILTNGTVLTNYSTDEYDPKSFENEAWFQALRNLKGFQSYWIGSTPTVFPYEKEKSPYQLSLARTLRLENSQIYGYVIVTMMESKFRHIFEGLAGERSMMLVDDAGVVVSAPSIDQIGSRYNGARAESIYLSNKPAALVAQVGNEKNIVTEMKLSTNAWHLISIQPYGEAIVNISSIFNQVFLLQMVLFGAILLMLLAFIRRHTNPLVKLGRIANKVQQGNLLVRTGIRGQDEIGRLGTSFDQMLDRVQEMIAEVTETQQRKRIAELAMLQAQINPHFLFNVMNSIRMKVLRFGDKESAKMISSLSVLLRMTISGDKDQITLHEEVELLGHYVELMNMRQKEKVQIEFNIDMEAFLLRVPRFILQPIVENAMIHGLDQKAGRIKITAINKSKEVIISIKDDGAGMDRQTLVDIQNKLSSHLMVHQTMRGESPLESGFGMLNVAERMRLAFGEGFIFQIRSELGHGTEIMMHIPVTNDVLQIS
ncbi:histidine kinase [Neobacillus mesonae]|nr:histidine kinase [Neobacillus mesonae]